MSTSLKMLGAITPQAPLPPRPGAVMPNAATTRRSSRPPLHHGALQVLTHATAMELVITAQAKSSSSTRPKVDAHVEKQVVKGLSMTEQMACICDAGQLNLMVEALDLLVQRGIPVDCSLVFRVLKRCIEQRDLELGTRVHALAVELGHETNAFLANHIIRMYASMGKVEKAMQAFSKVDSPDNYMWASIINAYCEHGQHQEAIRLYREMRRSTVQPNSYVFVAVLKACAKASDLAAGEQVHSDVMESACASHLNVGNCLVDMYAKCRSLDDARRVFDRLPKRDVVTWTAMMAGYTQHGLGKEALTLYDSMQQEGLTPANRVTFVCLLQACAIAGALQQGKQLHSQIQERGLDKDVVVGNCLLDMYAKCGSLADACNVFDSMPKRDVVTWNTLMNGYALHGDGRMSIQCFEKMQQQGVKPTVVTFICLLVACSHEGLVNEGRRYFEAMVEEHGIQLDVFHYNCIVDLLGRSGRLEEAENVLLTMPFDTDTVGWTALLTACKSHGDTERGRRCFDHLTQLEPENSTPYVLLASMYANVGRWNDVERIECLRRAAGAKKKPAKACIEVQSKLHEFIVGEERADISTKLRSLNVRLKHGGHVPQTELVLRPVSQLQKEDALCGHAEKLALAYGLLNTPDGTTLLVTKNLRMCNDCHSGTKVMSRIERREVIVRDSHRVHRFVDGTCSCGDRH